MRLKNITLHGFKSFANRTEIPLGPGITAIVGPNGCGKSNVSDGVRWILGEHNVRHLRGENILDVIFKGSGSAKPSGLAEVKLLIDNDDHALSLEQTEVSIARRVYRSGESDFLINNVPCRLKDIRNLFLGTGLGSNGYAVIEREMVDAVLSDRDEQRRVYFEEAAGVSRYKHQRREAVRKLEATEQDLTRIADIVREIDREVRSLARQVGKARRHQRLIDEIRTLEVDRALRQWAELQRLHDSCTSERDVWADHRARLSGDLSRRETELETRRIELLERERLLDESRREREGLLAEQSTAREEVSVLATRIQGWEQKEAELARRIREEAERETDLRARIESSAPERARLEADLASQQEAVEVASEAFREAEERLREARAEAGRKAQLQTEQLLARARDTKELESLDGMIAQHEVRRAALQVHHDGLAEKVRELDEGLRRAEAEAHGRAGSLAEIGRLEEEAEATLAALTAEREELRRRREDLACRRASIESRLSLLREQRARHEGFDLGVRHILEGRGELRGIHGVVGDLLVPSAGLADAQAESLLADAVQWIVVEDERSALEAIESLRSQGHGGVTFFPLKENRERFPSSPARWKGAAPIEGSADLQPLIRFLLGRLQPERSREEARRAARSADPALRYLSPEGEIFSGEGWIRVPGGRGPDREIVERMREIPRLEESLTRIAEDEADTAGRHESSETEWKALEERIRGLGARRASQEEEHRRLERERSERAVERGLLLEERERVSAELLGIGRQIDSLGADRRRLETRLGDAAASGRDADEIHRQAEHQSEECGAARDGALENLSRVRTESLRVENAWRELVNVASRDREEADRLAASLEEWGEEGGSTAAQREAAEKKRADLGERGREIDVRLLQIEKLLDERRGERDSIQTALAEQDHELRELRRNLDGLSERLHSDQVREVEIRSEMEKLRERIYQEFKCDIAEEAEKRAAAESEAAAEETGPDAGRSGEGDTEAGGQDADELERIAGLRQKLLALGPVNFVAAEEYSTQKERLLFHRRQQEDLLKARSDLLQAIQRINETAGSMFRETFEKARGHFRSTFEFLFPGGEADVTLAGDDPLEAGIEITARPRGKKLEAIRLLSTGERALTAIALLFGLYLVKPSPFCVLDELDAPLDDANIRRFVTLLRHFSERTQFVVITHNKRTMEAADRLYGVTMQQVGVSKIVSVRLGEGEGMLEPIITEAGVASSTAAGEA